MKKFLRNIKKYYSRKSKWSKITDALLFVIILLMLIPGTRTHIASFFIKSTLRAPFRIHSPADAGLTDADYRWPLSTPDGHPFYLDQVKDQLIFVNFWATWCPPCVAEMPGIERLYADYKDRVAFVMISQEDPAEIKAFINKNRYTFPVYIQHYQSPEIFKTNSIPITFLVSPGGKVLLKKKGAAKWDSQKIRDLLDSHLP